MARPVRKSPAATRPAGVSAKPTAAIQTSFQHLPSFFYKTNLHSLLIFLLALVLYANTLHNQWALDDAIVITENMFTQKGIKGIPDIFSHDTFYGFFKEEGKAALVSGGRYRPLTPAMFALVYEWVANPGKKPDPFGFHLLAIILFALTCVMLHRTILTLLNNDRDKGYATLLSLLAAVLFAVHPVHVEAVANIKGCDEIVSLLGSLAALWLSVKAFDTGKWAWAAAAGLTYFLALLSKENAATFLVIVPLALWTFRGASAGQFMKITLPLILAFAVFFGIRASVLPQIFSEEPKELMNNPYLKIENNQWVKFTSSERLATITYTLGKYLQLLFVPHPLTHDYYPRHIDRMTFGSPLVLLSFLVNLGLLFWSIWGILKGHRDVLRFGVLLYFITLSIVSNLIFPIGTNMGERFLFMPSVGFCIVIAALFIRWSKRDGKRLALPLSVFGCVAILLAAKTFTRNFDWYDDKTLFFKDVTVSERSAKIHNACGGVLSTEAGSIEDVAKKSELYQKSVEYFTKALAIHPTYKDALLGRGIGYFNLKNFDLAAKDFREAMRVAAGDPKGRSNLLITLREGAKFYGEQKNDLTTALKMLEEAIQLEPNDAETMRLLGVANAVGKNSAEAIRWFSKVLELQPDNANVWYDLGQVYGATGNVQKANEYMLKALSINPKLLEERTKK